MVLYPNKLPESERVCFGICNVVTMGDKATLKVQHNGKTILQQTQETKEL